MTKDLFAGVDPSIGNTGLVCLDREANVVLTLDGKGFLGKLEGFSRYIAEAEGLAKALRDAVGNRSFSVLIEDYSLGSVHRAYDLAEYGGVLKYALTRLGPSRIYLASPKVVKKFATGRGDATKADMVARAVLEDPCMEGRSEDVCDAYFMAKLCMFRGGCYSGVNGNLLRTRIEVSRGDSCRELKWEAR